ncbi:hypothetical protein AB0A77_28185 [Streptomyces varsoviensis]|uniref:hypothetical protein n=1 Tax=Streptomyces varsoviensis TaxID=67373 RepID=UPI0033C669F4
MSIWFPPDGDGLSEMQVGRWWDVVQAPDTLSRRIRSAGFVCAAHIVCPADACLLWLVPCGGTDHYRWGWERIGRYVTVRTGRHEHIPVPHVERTGGPGPHWDCPDFWPGGPRGYLTDAPALLTALEVASLVLGPPALCCVVCEQAAWPETRQQVVVSRGLTTYLDYAHPLCARAARLQEAPAEHDP